MISLNIVSDKSIWQQPFPCKHQKPVADGWHGAWGQRGQAAPGKPPTFSSAKLSLPPFCPKGLEFPITIPGHLPAEERFSLTPLPSGSSCKCLCPRSPAPTAISHRSCTVSDTTGFATSCCWVGESKNHAASTAMQARCGWGRAESLTPSCFASPHSFSCSNTSCFFSVKSDELFSQLAQGKLN